MKIGVHTTTRCTLERYFLQVGLSSQYKVNGKEIQLEELILLKLIEMKKLKEHMRSKIPMTDGLIILSTD